VLKGLNSRCACLKVAFHRISRRYTLQYCRVSEQTYITSKKIVSVQCSDGEGETRSDGRSESKGAVICREEITTCSYCWFDKNANRNLWSVLRLVKNGIH
jgi:hypothetical protein